MVKSGLILTLMLARFAYCLYEGKDLQFGEIFSFVCTSVWLMGNWSQLYIMTGNVENGFAS